MEVSEQNRSDGGGRADTAKASEGTGAVEPVFLDYQATTPVDPSVFEAMLPFLRGFVGNAHSSNSHGQVAKHWVEKARGQVAQLIGSAPGEIVFTSGATEANNLLIRGAASAGARAGRTRVVTIVTEHKSVLEVVRRLVQAGVEVAVLSVDADGLVDMAAVRAAVNEKTSLVTVMAANNEIGVLQPLADIGRHCRSVGALFHSDAAQAAGKVPLHVDEADLDLLSLSGHKIYGPMGIGAAYVRRSAWRRVDPLLHGGGQEGGLRSGTLPVALAVGLGEACRLAAELMPGEAARLKQLRELFLAELRGGGVEFVVNGSMDKRLPGNLNVSFTGVDAEALLMSLRAKLSIASGSACTAQALEPSHVVQALGGRAERAEEAVRIGFGRPTSEAEVVAAGRFLVRAVARLASVSYGAPAIEGMRR